MLDQDVIRWAYRILLDREVESDATVQDKTQRLESNSEMLMEFLSSDEFQKRNLIPMLRTMGGSEPPLQVEVNVDQAGLRALLEHIARSWDGLGRSEPHWSVLTAEQFKSANIAGNIDKFYESGRANAETLFKILTRSGVAPDGLRTALEYGCGLGRITRWLAPSFTNVCAVDISGSHLAGAKEHLKKQGISNVEFVQIQQIEQLEQLPMVDLVYSVIVLQHNPPPVIALILRALLGRLKPGGAAVIQLPTYRRDYQFDLESYLASRGEGAHVEMHLLPQPEVFRIAKTLGVDVLEVLEDAWVGSERGHRSNTFTFQRPS